jgi:tetratricopeptide (TPR) repeat protein
VPTKPPYTSELIHDSGVETVASGFGAGDPGAVISGIALLEAAARASPGNTAFWLDLADAYANSGIATEIPYAIDIYWMLLAESPSSQDALLVRLTETYARIGNRDAAHTVGVERLRRAPPEKTDQAALHLVLLALANNRLAETATVLAEKSKSLSKPAYLFLLSSACEEAAGNSRAAMSLLDDAIRKLDGNPAALAVANRARERLSP